MTRDVSLGPRSLLVRGGKRTAIYDLESQRCIRLPAEILREILSPGPSSARVDALRTRLLAMGYLIPGVPHDHSPGFNLGHRRSLVSPTAVLSVDATFLDHADSGDFLRHMMQLGQSQHLLINLNGRSVSRRAQRALRASGLGYEMSPGIAGDEHRAVFDRNHKHIGYRRFSRNGRPSQRFRFDYQTILRNYHWYEGYGLIHIRGDGSVWPNASEATFSLGSVAHVHDGTLLEQHGFRLVCDSPKAARDTCCDCEFRLACNWSVSSRSEAARITSSPAGCGYDPLLEDGQDAIL
jgi:hypothetical protein